MAQDSEATSTMTSSPSLFLPDSVPDEFKDNTFLDAIKSAKQTLGSVETGLSAKSEFELYFQTGPSTLDYTTLHKRAQNVDIRHSKIRSVYWKVFLSVIGNDTASWKHTLHKKRAQYTTLKDKYINDAMKEDDDSASNLIIDNPLLSASGGKWDKYYKDNELRDTIVLDVDRTYPEDDFFVNKIVQNSLTDILFIYCKENEWISYKQGMNEIIAALFMVNTVQSTISPYVDDDSKIKTDHNTTAHHTLSEDMSLWETVQDIRYIEHDTYFMFREIMNIMGQYFINATGKEVPPVVERSKRIQGQFLRQMDTQLAQHLLKINLTPQLYGLRWIRLFFSREFHLRDVCVVWDAIFGAYSERKQAQQKNMDKDKGNTPGNGAMDPSKAVDYALDRPHKIKLDFRFVDYMSCSMLLFIRHQLIGRDISHCLRRVMRYPPIEDVASLIERAYTIRDHIERRGKKSNEYAKERRIKDVQRKKKWTSSELLTPFNLPVHDTHRTNHNHSKHHSKRPINANKKYHYDTFEGYSVDWISRHNQPYKPPKPVHSKPRSSLPNFSPISVQRVPSAQYGKTKSELITNDNDTSASSYELIADSTKTAVGVAAVAVSGLASTLWSSYGTKIVSNSIDTTRSASKHYNRIEQNVKKKISVLPKYVPPHLSKVPSKVIKAKKTVSALSENVLKPLYQYNNRPQTDPMTDFVTYTPPKRFPFENPVKCVTEEKKMRLMSPDCKEEESEEEEDVFHDEHDEDSELISNADTAITVTTTSTDITYNNINMSSFSIDDHESKPSIHTLAPTIISMPSVSRSTSASSTSSSLSSVMYSVNDKMSYLNMFTSIQQTFEYYYYYNNVIMTPQQHLMSRLRELEQIRINFVLCITKSFEYNLIECNVSDFSRHIPQFDFGLFIEFNNDLYTSQSLNNARLYYLNYLHSFVIHVNNALTEYNQYYINMHRSKTAMSNNLNIADRWNQFSRTVSSAMTTYAEDVKSLMGGQRRTLKSRMQFEYALGTKMGQVLKHVQGTINNHRGQLNDAFMSETLRTAAPMMDTNEIKSNANAVDSIETDSKEDQERHDPLSTTSTLEDPLDAKPKPKQVEEENPLLVIEEALAELKLVKDALMGNLDETQLESWLDWTFVEPSPEPKPNENAKLNKHKSSPPLLGLIKSSPPLMALRRKKPSHAANQSNSNNNRRNLRSSGLVPPRKSKKKSPNLQHAKPMTTVPQHPLD
eukprot:622281_1